MLAKVAVTIRARSSDKLYDYRADGDVIVLGERVLVPFGKRHVEGYVIAVEEEPLQHNVNFDVKTILRSLDAPSAPTLTPDLVALTRFLRERYLCTWGAALQTVLPPAVRTKEVKRLKLVNETDHEPLLRREDGQRILAYFSRHRQPTYESLQKNLAMSSQQIKHLIELGILEESQTVEARVSRKIVKMVELVKVPPSDQRLGVKQQAVLAYLARLNDAISLTQLCIETGATASVCKTLEQRGLLMIKERFDAEQALILDKERPKALTQEQQIAYATIESAIEKQQQQVFLLQGVTGSGKTEVYLQAIEKTQSMGKTAIMLVPEIALTAQMTARFRARFGEQLAVLHSRLSEGEKNKAWHNVRDGRASVVIGARSAIFAPLPNVGLIIIDEEHEASYKQESDPRYVTREVAVKRASITQSVLLLGSATPSLETMYRAEKGTYQHLTLKQRYSYQSLPDVQIVDMREHMRRGSHSLFSPPLQKAIQEVLDRKEQAILFLNKRGYATFLLCRDCGEVVSCPSCDISLTLHKGHEQVLRCHYCGYQQPVIKQCPVCHSEQLRPFGAGTQKVEQELLAMYDHLRIIRMDVDTTSTKGSHERLLCAFERGEADILLGTQMIAKGLDFSRVSFVGVIAADISLYIPDYRAAERTFELLVQVAGRAGRHAISGSMIVQTFNPEHYAIVLAAQQDYEAFYQTEMQIRQKMAYPPFTEVSVFAITHEREEIARQFSHEVHDVVASMIKQVQDVRLFPAAPASLARLRNRYRYQVVVKYRSFYRVQKILAFAYEQAYAKAPKDVTLTLDVNAHSLL